jgi:hypothetical protein
MKGSFMRDSDSAARLVTVLSACDDFLTQWAGQRIDQRPEALDRLALDAYLCSTMAGSAEFADRQSLFDGDPMVDK